MEPPQTGVTRVGWRTSPRLATALDLKGHPGVEVVQLGAQPLPPLVEVVVLDTRGFDGIDDLLQERETMQAPVLVLADQAELAALDGRLQPTDGILLHDAPLVLVAHHLRLLARWASLQLDGLTKLRVRRAFLTHLERQLPDARPERPLSVLLVDIDHFKAVNDEYGHSVGDMILQELARRIMASCPFEAFPARFSGEKFVILLAAGEDEAVSHAELLREAVRYRPFAEENCAASSRSAPQGREERNSAHPERPAGARGTGIRLAVSVGVATAHHPIPSRELLKQMDEALYAAKAGGRDRTVHYGELEREAIRADQDIDLFAFENVTRVIAERVANVITRRGRRLFHEIKQQADIDSLTGLYSRRYLDRRLGFEFEESQRTHLALTVALVDIDFFGEVNKTHGWPTGDRVLAGLALLIRQNVRASDWVARYGGEEFCLVLAGTPLAMAVPVLERVRLMVEQHTFATETGDPVRITVSLGAVERSAEDQDLAALVERSSDRLLDAKRGGRNRVCS